MTSIIRYVVPADQKITLTADKTTNVTFENNLKKFCAEITKRDAEATAAQGNATLAGAVYGLYCDGKLVDTYTTDKNGKFMTKEYPCGNYTIQEISPSNGYLLNTEVYAVGAEPKHYPIAHNTVKVSVPENVIKGNVSILKHSDRDETVVEHLEAGAEFEIYLSAAGSYAAAKESERDHLVTDEKGYAVSKMLPYGLYTVHQTKTVNDAAFVPDFQVQISENKKTYEYVLNNAPFTSYLYITKIDAESGNPIAYAGAGFQIYDESGNLINMGVDTFYTNAEGYLMTPDVLEYGKYFLVEVEAPEGYVLDSTPVPFTISAADAEEENAVNIVRITQSDMPQKGKISIKKSGDRFSHVTEMDAPVYNDENGNEIMVGVPVGYTPEFTESCLAGAKFTIAAAEDIVTGDGTVHAKAGDIVAELITDENGYAETELLYLGKYTIRETNAPYGYVLDGSEKTVELSYAGQEIAIRDTVDSHFVNAYQSVQIHLAKAMEQDGLFDIGENGEYLAVRFGLFAAENITAADGTMIPADGYITSVSLQEDMTATIAEQLPFGKYYVQEIATDEHYTLNGEKYLVTFEYMGQEMTTVDIDCGVFENTLKRGSVEGQKIDTEGNALPGALFGLFSAGTEDFSESAALLTDVSDENGNFRFSDIPYGDYVVREIQSPGGYILSDEIYPVTITEDSEVIGITAENSPISVAISKRDVYGEELSGAQMQLVSEHGDVVGEWTSDGTDHVISHISAGSYTLKELAAPDGYCIASDIAFSVDEYGIVTVDGVQAEAFTDDGTPLLIMTDDTTKVQISKQDVSTGQELPGAKLQILDMDGNLVEEWISTNEPHCIEAVLISGVSYLLREITAPDGYALAEDVKFTVNADGSLTEVIMKDAPVPVITTPGTPPTGDPGRDPLGYALVLAGVIGCMLAIFKKKGRD